MNCKICNKVLGFRNNSGYCSSCYHKSPQYKKYQRNYQKKFYRKNKKYRDYKKIKNQSLKHKKYMKKYLKKYNQKPEVKEKKLEWERTHRKQLRKYSKNWRKKRKQLNNRRQNTMKIKISNVESYEISLPEEISGRNFKILLRRLNDIAKLMEKSNGIKQETSINIKTKKKKRKYIRSNLVLDRTTTVKLLKAHYEHRKKKDKQEAMSKIVKGINVENFLKRSTRYKFKYNIKPQEVGLKRFPKANEIWKIESLKLKK
ncbi:MAG: hypothetical protein ACFFDN_06915 [Candidatus Hodarchaeota archaeon]